MNGILCGHCGNRHDTVQGVRLCSQERHGMDEDTKAESSPPSGHRAEDPRTPWIASDAGIYIDADENVYKVYKALNKDHMLCKRLVMDKYTKRGTFVYVGIPRRFVRHDQKIDLERASKFGLIYGVCIACGRILTDETSIRNGIGPVCAGKVAF